MKRTIKHVPLMRQNQCWGGYVCLATILQYWGYEEATPGRVFKTIHGSPEPRDPHGLMAAACIGQLACAADELAPYHRVDLLTAQDFVKLCARNHRHTPQFFLQKCLTEGWPCILRFSAYYLVIVGFDDLHHQYAYHELANGTVQTMSASILEHHWGIGDRSLHLSTRYLMLVIRPQ